ncbi:Elongation factor Ts [Ephemeroptericola cinctiostellae]|uniref:Elongation factor Ts n=1 Tax=Ephemeroptericola cinctiostellae TaxID=2268024 RepID=A0A345DBF1_9BURK|nr:translation elongation factor Ts [Ephemeroptericola cinctiostellae]AXF85689.1 Elongation factor Ts [Ephemeroptericola cinctiostellae]
MTAITAGMVSELRGKTDAPMMECKKALVEAEGNMERAEEILRVKLGSKAGKASSRIAAEGVVVVYTNGTQGAMVEVNSETDFVAKNDDFLALANGCAKLVAEHNPVDVEALSALDLDGKTVEQTRADLIGKIGENMTIRRFVRFDSDNSLVSYLHGAKIGVVVSYKGDETAAKDVAMHIAAMKPVALSSADVPAKLIETERKVATEKAIESGKPADIAAKMVEGSVQKFLKEVSLFDQPFVKNDKETVAAMLKSKATEVAGFTMFIVGEGIEKKVDDFAAEVAAQVAAAQAGA